MAKRVRLKDVKHVNLEINAWLLEWTTNPEWTPEDFGNYWLISLLLYSQGGSIEYNIDRLSKYCRRVPDDFAKSWSRIKSKFTLNGNVLVQKRVKKELKESRRRMQTAVDSGLKGAKRRWGTHSDPNGEPVAKRIRGIV